MGKLLSRNASIERIKEAANRTLTAARARGGEIQTTTEARIATPLAALDSNDQQLTQARTTDDNLHAALMARDEESRWWDRAWSVSSADEL